jgi:hypothetical protein
MSAVALLLALLVSMTGIDRTVDPGLTSIAERRVVEIATEFSHDGADPCCVEVLAWNSGFADPITHIVDQWQGSPQHWAILTDPSYTAIGCAVAFVQNRAYAACVLNESGVAVSADPAPATPAPTPAPALPDTSMSAP